MWLIYVVLASLLSFGSSLNAADDNQSKDKNSIEILTQFQDKIGNELLEDFVTNYYNLSFIASLYDVLGLKTDNFKTRDMLHILENLPTLVSKIKIELTIKDFIRYLKSRGLVSFWDRRRILKYGNTDESNLEFQKQIRSILYTNIREKFIYNIKNNIKYLNLKIRRKSNQDLPLITDTNLIQSILKSKNIPTLIKSTLIDVATQAYFEDSTTNIRGYDLLSNSTFIKHLLMSSDVPNEIKDEIVQRMKKAEFDVSSILKDIRRYDSRSIIYLSDFFNGTYDKDSFLSTLLQQKINNQNLTSIVLTPLGWNDVSVDSHAFELIISLFDASTRQIQRYITNNQEHSTPLTSKLYNTAFFNTTIKEISEDLTSELFYVLGFLPTSNKQEIINSHYSNFWNSSFSRSLQSVIKERVSILFHKDLVKKIHEAFRLANSSNNWASIDEVLKNRNFASLLYKSRFIPDDVKLMIYQRVSRLFSSSTDKKVSSECTSVFKVSSKEEKDI